jgi:flagellar protein FlaG
MSDNVSVVGGSQVASQLSATKAQSVSSSANITAPKEAPEIPTTQFKVNEAQVYTDSDVKKAIHELNSFLESQSRELSFSYDKIANKNVVRLFNSNTGEMVRQFPDELIIAASHNLDRMIGILFNEKT